MHSEASPEHHASQRCRSVWWKRAVLALMVLVPVALVLLAVYGYVFLAADRALQDAIAEADRLDPGWRWDDLEAKRAILPDAENAALRVLEASRLLPTHPWPPPPQQDQGASLEDTILALSPAVQLDDRLTRELQERLHEVGPALAAAQALRTLPRGRYPMSWRPDTFAPDYSCQHARQVATLLRLQAALLAQDKDADAALTLSRAIVNAGRSIGDEPALMSQLVRMGCQSSALASMERTLGQGQPSEQALAAVQRLLEEEATEPLLLVGLRGDRAGEHRKLEAIEAGELKFSQMANTATPGKTAAGWEAKYTDFSAKLLMRRNHAPLLHLHTQAVEIAKLPVEAQGPRFRELQALDGQLPILAGLTLPSLERAAAAFRRQQARLRCSIAAVAAERYRRSRGHWPGSLRDLVAAGLIRQVPADPYDGVPLRFRATPTGLIIYSIGPDQEDNGGKLNRINPVAKGSDLGFELWNAEQRRRPAVRSGDGPE